MAHWSTNLTMHQPRPTTQGVQDHSKLHHQPSPPKLTLPDTHRQLHRQPRVTRHPTDQSGQPKQSHQTVSTGDRRHKLEPAHNHPTPIYRSAITRALNAILRTYLSPPPSDTQPTSRPAIGRPASGRPAHAAHARVRDRRVHAVYTSPPPLSLIEAAGAGDPAPEDYGVPDTAVAHHQAELFEHPAYGGPYARAAALVHTLEQRLNLTISRSAVPRTPPASSCCPPPLGGRAQPRVDDARTPPREGLRTAYPTLRDPDHLGRRHPHDQATRPERATPSWARRPAPTNGSPTPSTRSRAARTTIALPRPGRDRCLLCARDCRRLVGQAVWGCRMRAPCGRRPSPLSG